MVVFGSRPLVRKVEGLHLSLLGKELTPAKSAKGLGVILDPNLTYEDHTTKTVSTCMSRLGQINRVKHVLDMDTLTIVVNCVVFSKLFYCSHVWINTPESNLDKVQKVQNFACRIISGVKKFDYITAVLRVMLWLPIRQQLYYRNTVIAFNCVTGCAPYNSDSLTDQFILINLLVEMFLINVLVEMSERLKTLRHFDRHHKKFKETSDSLPKVCNWKEIPLL